MSTFKELSIPGFIEDYGAEIRRKFVVPLLRKSAEYLRISSYFRVASLVSIAAGLEKLVDGNGKFQVLLGDHDVDPQLMEAFLQSQDTEQQQIREALEDRLAREASTLSSELELDAISTVAWLIHTGRLEIRIGATRSQNSGSILHNKRLIFIDSEQSIVAASGSQNETLLTDIHYEELSIHKSWVDPDTTNRMLRSFREMWSGNNPHLKVIALSADLALKLATATGKPLTKPTTPPSGISLHEALSHSPSHAQFMLPGIALFPHQERVLRDGLARLPIRMLLADEVGLGKTLEAISLLSVLENFCGAEDFLLVGPPSLLFQWQEELEASLGQSFLRWDSGSKGYRTIDNQLLEFGPDSSPLRPNAPQRILLSNAIFRARAFDDEIAREDARFPAVIVVDEAHAARVRTDGTGRRRETLLWKQLNRVSAQIEHMILLTATPMQVQPLEFFELISLLGLPDSWSDYGTFEKSFFWLTNSTGGLSLPEAGEFAEAFAGLIGSYGLQPSKRIPGAELVLSTFAKEEDLLARARFVLENWAVLREALIHFHPANQLVVRNTRVGLEKLGYKFPERDFSAPELVVSEQILDFHDRLTEYLSTVFGATEEAMGNGKSGSKAFQQTHWWERTSSSMYAARQSLRNRIARLTDAATGHEISLEGDDWDEAFVDSRQRVLHGTQRKVVRQTALREISYLESLADIAQEVIATSGGVDPKFVQLGEEVRACIREQRPVLVFSRWVDTLEGCVDYVRPILEASAVGYGMYTGDQRWVSQSGTQREVTKYGLIDELREGRIQIVFCSEAASEGLNLQTANRLINIDVPWNPAKLEQRIGRIARLGQESDVVGIVNLWYPGSIEQKIYRRLFERKSLFSLAVGEMPELFSDSILKAVTEGITPDAGVGDATERLESSRRNIEAKALREIWDVEIEANPKSYGFRESIGTLVALHEPGSEDGQKHSEQPGSRDAFSISSLQMLKMSELEAHQQLLAVSVGSEFVAAFAHRTGPEVYRLVAPEAVVMYSMRDEGGLGDDFWVGGEFSISELPVQLCSFMKNHPWFPGGLASKIEGQLAQGEEVLMKPITHIS